MKYRLFTTTLLISFLIAPQISSAAWWNPFSWFEAEYERSSDIIEEGVSTTTPEEHVEQTQDKSKPEIREVIKEVEVVKTIDNPQHVKTITSLEEKIAELEASLTTYKKLNFQLIDTKEKLESENKKMNERFDILVETINNYDEELKTAIGYIKQYQTIVDIYESMSGSSGYSTPNYSEPSVINDSSWLEAACPPGTIPGRYGPSTCGN